MMTSASSRASVRLHLTNIAGAGASQLLQSLLPALEHNPETVVERIELPDRGKLTNYHSNGSVETAIYHRRLPNALSRILECTFLANQFDGSTPLLVLGDLPLRSKGPQTVFVQTSNLLNPERFDWRPGNFKYALARSIFRMNMDRVQNFIVQTSTMRDALVRSYPAIEGRVHIVAQPVPSWLLKSGLRRGARKGESKQGLRLIYPATDYPHKNHALLSRLDPRIDWPVESLNLTLDSSKHPAPQLPWVRCKGFLSSEMMIQSYSEADALVFLSQKESYGFPLVEAMYVGLPIVCPDLPYAHTLCGEEAVYFDPDDPQSFYQALNTLKCRLDQGWWPNWFDRLSNFPDTWEGVAHSMLEIACSGK